MKRFFVGLLFLVPFVAGADEIRLFNAVATNATSETYDLSGFTKVTVQVTSAAGSVAVFTWSCRNTANDPWGTAFSVSNPSATEVPHLGPGACFCKADISGWSSGTISATMRRTK